ncbi:hypothetical protein DRW48_12715 [Paracoccus suum]|uniref:Phytoene synthase n=1 Tax=Paracoccus suum TaxID=2259340 RepID=A0A344PM24_9RHOB|nr:squalene/phytoene synthase family protein [Paracoccus suum]AXC50429.1 hypothetical protein DRW48_12715 [Paracoccus suum]
MSLQSCVEVLQLRDPDRLSALLTAPLKARPRLLSLYAVAAELARAPGASAEPALAEIRLQWWIDALETLPTSAGLHPVLAALAEAWGADGPALATLGEGQRIACEGHEFSAAAEALAWIDSTDGALAVLGAEQLGLPPDAQAVVRAQGRALGVARYLHLGGPRGLPEAGRAELLHAGRKAARTAADGPPLRQLAPVLAAGPDLQGRLKGSRRSAQEIARRWAALRVAFTGQWKISLRR